jgi:hypothetical protein
MGTTLSKGYIVPDVGEEMVDWTDDLEANIIRINAHNHDGSNSQALTTKDLIKSTTTISSGSWAAVSGQAGTYRQLVTLPTGYSVDSSIISIVNSSGHPLDLTIEKVSTFTFYVYVNDNTLNLTAKYG